MKPLRRKRLFHIIIHSKITVAIALGACVILATSVYERFVVEREMAERRMVADEELRELRVRKDGLEEKVRYLSNESGVESEIRKNFDVAKEGEQVVIIVEEEQVTTLSESESSTSEEETVREERSLFPWW